METSLPVCPFRQGRFPFAGDLLRTFQAVSFEETASPYGTVAARRKYRRALSAMWLYAMSSGSAARGALVMLVFSLGTVPLLFLFGALQSFLPRGWMKYIVKGSAVLVVTLGLSMLVKGIRLFGM